MICTKKFLKSEPISIENCNVELSWIRINFVDKNILIIAVYIPTQLEEFKGNALLEKYISTENIIEDLKQMYPEDNLIIVGDLNLSKINWSNEDLLVFRGMGPVRELNRSAASCVGMCLRCLLP